MKDICLNDGEVVEPLDDDNIIIQPKDGYRFGGDSVALANFVAKSNTACGKNPRIFELCSGCGIIGILLAIANRKSKIFGAEIDATMAEMSMRSAAANGLSAEFYNADIRKYRDGEYKHIFERGAFDIVVCNPPYYKPNMPQGDVSPNATSEITVNFNDVAKAAAWLLRDNGAFYFVHWSYRLDEIFETLNAERINPKELIVNRNGKTFMVKAVKNSRRGLSVNVEGF